MITIQKVLGGLGLLASLTIGACSTSLPRESYLLGDLSEFEQRGAHARTHVVVPSGEFDAYRRVRIDPTLVEVHPGSAWAAASASEQHRIKALLRDALKREFGADYEVVLDPAARSEDLMIVRAAIVGITTPSDGTLGSDLSSATLELEALDSMKRERLIALTWDARTGSAPESTDGGLDEAGRIVDRWVSDAYEWLDQRRADPRH